MLSLSLSLYRYAVAAEIGRSLLNLATGAAAAGSSFGRDRPASVVPLGLGATSLAAQNRGKTHIYFVELTFLDTRSMT